MKCAFLVGTIPGFFSACIEALADLPGVEVLLLGVAPQKAAPFDMEEVTPRNTVVRTWSSIPTAAESLAAVNEFAPDVIIVSGWQIKAYRHVAKALSGRCLRVVLMDNQWFGTPKQLLGVATSRFYLHPLFDIAFLPGRNQEVFAKKLGFDDHQIWRGAYSCDLPRFLHAGESVPVRGRKRCFIFVGRLVPAKGLDILAEAYSQYRRSVDEPWDLEIYGTGQLSSLFDDIDGATLHGFVQPRDLPLAYATSGCFVMPSRFEPWGAVIQEAAAARLPVICTTVCGAAPHLVEDSVSGYLVEAENVEALAKAFRRISSLDPDELDHMSEMSVLLAQRYSPQIWASTFEKRMLDILEHQHQRDPQPSQSDRPKQ